MLPKLQITKLDASRRQLETAIRLYFHENDAVSIHNLTAAAYNILRDLARHRGNKGMIVKDQLIDSVKIERRDEVRGKINEAENYFKHADRDPDEIFLFSPKQSELLLYDACLKYRELSGEYPSLIQLFLAWLAVSNPDLFILPPHWEAIRSNFASHAALFNRMQFYNEYLPIIVSVGMDPQV